MGIIVVASKIKQLAKAGQLRVSAEFIHALSGMVGRIVIASAKKCKEDGMGTIKARHLTLPEADVE
jgi:hypothetical protein